MKAILIARVSTEEQREAGNSLPAQVARLERYCKNKNYSILRTCTFDESAYSSERSEFDAIIDFVLEQKEKVVVCCDKVDRISRNVFDKRISLLYEKALRDELELHFVSDNQIINSQISATEKFQFSISLGLAKYYSDAISDNVRRGNEQKLRKGEWLSRAPFAYKNIRNADGSKDIILDEYKAGVVKEAFELYAIGAYSMIVIAKKLSDKYNINLSKAVLANILKNPFYHGVMIVKNKEYPHRYATIISKDIFDKTQERISGFKKKKYKYAGKTYLYRGLLKCAHCGLTITPETHKGHVYYHCTQYRGKHDAKWLREEDITESLLEVFKNISIPKKVMSRLIETLDEVHQDKMEFHNMHHDRLVKEQKDLTKMIDNLYLDKLRGKIDEERYERVYESLRDKLENINLNLEKLQDAEDNYYINAKYTLDICNRAQGLFLSSEVKERRQIIKMVLQNLRVDGECVVYEVQKPFDLILDCSKRQSWCA